jgi:Flp pilus assembly pilin Flp
MIAVGIAVAVLAAVNTLGANVMALFNKVAAGF